MVRHRGIDMMEELIDEINIIGQVDEKACFNEKMQRHLLVKTVLKHLLTEGSITEENYKELMDKLDARPPVTF